RGRHTRPRRRPQAARPVAEPKRSLCHPRPLHGFTLVELLVVVAIIALLIAILLPGLQKARAMASGLACLSNQRQIVLGLAAYAGDNQAYYPPNSNPNVSGANGTWLYALWTYVGYPLSSYRSDPPRYHGVQFHHPAGTFVPNDIFYCPISSLLDEATPKPAGVVTVVQYSYGMNQTPAEWTLMLQGVAQWTGWNASNPTSSGAYYQAVYLPQRPDRITRQPAATALVMDCGQSSARFNWNSPSPAGTNAGGVIPHLGGANVSYFDMHGRLMNEAEIPLSPGGLGPTTSVFWKGQ
ncbi:MAG: prepilin-type N-terminal cleavage/methylation domain-containing protein, partial [Phycisphaerales bacterium]